MLNPQDNIPNGQKTWPAHNQDQEVRYMTEPRKYNYTKKTGRPSGYDPKYIDMVDDYLKTTGIVEKEFHKTRSDNSNSYEREYDVNLPKVEGFSSFIDVPLSTMKGWEDDYPEFSTALDKIRKEQHNMIVDGMASGKISQVLGKLMLSSNHGYREKSDLTTDGKAINLSFDNSFNE